MTRTVIEVIVGVCIFFFALIFGAGIGGYDARVTEQTEHCLYQHIECP